MAFVLHYYPGQFHNPKNPGISPGKHILPKYDEVVSVPEGTTMGGGLLVVLKDGKEIATANAWGGPSKKIDINKISTGKPLMPELPTPAGKYIIGEITAYHTPSWSFSKIRWGTPIKDVPGEEHLPETKKTDIWYQRPPGKDGKPRYGSVLKDTGITRATVRNIYYHKYGLPNIPKTWIFNDFGPVAIRYFRDLNNNKKLDKNEKLEGTMFHTTPDNEAQQWHRDQEQKQGKPITTEVVLENSHGCIHLPPAARASMQAKGFFKKGTTLIIHPYKEIYHK